MRPSRKDLMAMRWLRRCPPGARLAWGTHHLSLREPFAYGWVDVGLPPLMDVVGWNWVWTIEDPSEPEPAADVFSFRLPYDALLELHMPPGRERGVPLEVRLVCEDGRALPFDWLLEHRPNDEDWALGQRTILVARPDGNWLVRPVWTPAAISRGIERWVRTNVGRDDVGFYWDPQLPGNPVAEEIARLLGSAQGEEPESEPAGIAPVPDSVVELLVADDPDIRAGW